MNKLLRFTCNFAILPFAILLGTQPATANEIDFSAPTTAPEKALHAILQRHGHETGQRSTDLFEFLTQRSGRSKANDGRYQSKFTASLVQAIRAVEQSMHEKDCEGICGLDFDPITCAQDILLPPHAYFTTRTEKTNGWPTNSESNAQRAYVLYRNSQAGNPYVYRIDYLLEKEHGTWKIAGVFCHADKPELAIKFNM